MYPKKRSESYHFCVVCGDQGESKFLDHLKKRHGGMELTETEIKVIDGTMDVEAVDSCIIIILLIIGYRLWNSSRTALRRLWEKRG